MVCKFIFFPGLSNELSQPNISNSCKCESSLVPVNHVENMQ